MIWLTLRETSRKPDEVYGVIERYVTSPILPDEQLAGDVSQSFLWWLSLKSVLHHMGGS